MSSADIIVTVNSQKLENVQRFIAAFPGRVDQSIELAFADLQPALMSALEAIPGKVKYPILWTSERQRRAYFASKGFGKGIPSKRSGKLPQSWTSEIKRPGGNFLIWVANSQPYAKYVYGALRNRGDGDPQQRFHINTGWKTQYNTIVAWVDEYRDVLNSRIQSQARAALEGAT